MTGVTGVTVVTVVTGVRPTVVLGSDRPPILGSDRPPVGTSWHKYPPIGSASAPRIVESWSTIRLSLSLWMVKCINKFY